MSEFRPSKRQSAILDMVVRDGFVSTDAMVTEFSVTPQTIRRDLNELGREGLLTRFHGGAGQAKSVQHEPYADRQQSAVQAKRRIAEDTATLVPDGASLFLNTGTTTEAVARALLEHRGLYVVTNNINIARIMSRNETFQIMLAGGEVRNSDGGIFGASMLEFVRGFRLDIGIISISAIESDGAIMDFDREEAMAARAILNQCRRRILVADRDKFGRGALNRVGTLADLDTLVTDMAPDPAYDRLCEAGGTELRIAGQG